MDTALLVIDAQVHMFDPTPVYRSAEVLENLRELIARARAAGAPVIFFRYSGMPGDPDEPHTPGWELHPEIVPTSDEIIIDKHEDDSFYQSPLAGILAARGIRKLVIGGVQTEYCIDTTCRRAYSLDYKVTLAADAHSTYPGVLPAEQIIAHHNHVLRAYADVRPAAEIQFQPEPPPAIKADGLTSADVAAIGSGLKEWAIYETWLATGTGNPYWPHTHPGRVADTLRQMWDPAFTPRGRYTDPPRWELSVARAFMQPLENIPMAFRRTSLQSVTKAIDHLLQNPRNPLSPHMSQVGEQVWLYDAHDLRLFYVPSTMQDSTGRDRHIVFLLWLAAGIPVRNPFAM